jgi:hypothetical protein
MESKSKLLDKSLENILFFRKEILSGPEKKHFQKDFSQKVEHPGNIYYNSLINFWNRLIFKPKSITQKPNASIFSILEKEKNKLTTDIVKSILSKKLNLSMTSPDLSLALEKSNKIYHEDFPWDFILEYDGERLGIVLLDFCYNSNEESIPIYRFNPDIKSFRGMY